MSEPVSKKLCTMWRKSCDQCPECDVLQPIENVWEDLLREDDKAEQMSREHCRNLDDATSWPLFLINKSVERLRSFGAEIPRQTILSPLPKVDLVQTPALHVQDHVCDLLLKRMGSCVYTTAFSGLDAPGVALGMLFETAKAVRHTLVDVNAGVRLPDGLTRMKHGAAIEWCNSAIRELKHHPSRPGCLFRDISSFLRPEFRELSGRDLMARVVAGVNIVQPFAYCEIHGRECRYVAAPLHLAGPPCVDWSSMGSGKGRDGPTYRHYTTWMAQRRLVREAAIVMENVLNQDYTTLDEGLGDLYWRQSVATCPTEYGYPTERPRRYNLLLLKSAFEVDGVNTLQQYMGMQEWFDMMKRTYDFSWRSYMVAPRADIVKDLAWAENRPSSSVRHERDFPGPLTLDAAFLQALSPREWIALWNYKLKAGFHRTYNLGQNPEHICMTGSETTLGTIIKSTSMLWADASIYSIDMSDRMVQLPPHGDLQGPGDYHMFPRWLTPYELLVAQGIPVFGSAVPWATEGDSADERRIQPVSSFQTRLPERSRGQVCQMAGNTMHVVSIGLVAAYVVLCLPITE